MAASIPRLQTKASAFLVNRPRYMESSDPDTVPETPARTVITPNTIAALRGRRGRHNGHTVQPG